MSRLESLLLRKRARWVRRGVVGKVPAIGNSLAVYSTAMRRFFEIGWACGRRVGVESSFAGPQSRDFKRWASETLPGLLI